MNNQTTFIYGIGIGIIIGCIIINKSFILPTYILAILIARIILSYGIYYIIDIDKSDIKCYYNWYHNTIIIKRNFRAKILIDSDKIENIIKDEFDKALIWDIFYQYQPLKIIFV